MPGQRPGVIGNTTSEFIDFLAKSGQRYWQIYLSIHTIDSSPYAGISAFAEISICDQTAMEKVDDTQSRRAMNTGILLSYWQLYTAFRAIKDLLGSMAGFGLAVSQLVARAS